jgi:hypothetical protein
MEESNHRSHDDPSRPGHNNVSPHRAGLPQMVALLADTLGVQRSQVVSAMTKNLERVTVYSRAHAANRPAPRPTRFKDMGYDRAIAEVLGLQYRAYERALSSDLMVLHGLERALKAGELHEVVVDAILGGSQWGGEDESYPLTLAGMGLDNALEFRFIRRNGVIIDVAPELHELLRETNIADDLTWSLFRLPYPAIYVHLPEAEHNGAVLIRDPFGGVSDRNIDGFYAFEDVDDEGRRTYVMHLVQNVEVPGHPYDASAANHGYLSITVTDPDADINATIAEQIAQRHPDEPADSDLVLTMRSAFDYLAKVILYMSVKDRRMHFEKNRSEADKKVRASPAGIVRQKRAEKAQCLYDRIVIGQGIPRQYEASPGAGGVRVVHWRRGHIRRQRIGEGRRDFKVVFIMPMVIGDNADGKAPSRKDYLLKT